MNLKKYRQTRVIVALFIGLMVSIATTQNNQWLSIISVLTGMLFLFLVRSKTKIMVDERDQTIREKAAQLTYAIFAPTIGLGSFFLTILGQRSLYLFALGQIFAYLTLFIIAIYALSYHFLNRKYGGRSDEE